MSTLYKHLPTYVNLLPSTYLTTYLDRCVTFHLDILGPSTELKFAKLILKSSSMYFGIVLWSDGQPWPVVPITKHAI